VLFTAQGSFTEVLKEIGRFADTVACMEDAELVLVPADRRKNVQLRMGRLRQTVQIMALNAIHRTLVELSVKNLNSSPVLYWHNTLKNEVR
jgi:hypothetical protein